MKSLTNNTLALAVAMTLWATVSMAGEVSTLPMGTSEKDAAASPAPFHALSRLDAQSLAAQEMTEQELKAVEGGYFVHIDVGWTIWVFEFRDSGTTIFYPEQPYSCTCRAL
jgi:bacteriocin-like protein